jgi:hypothetical protein
MQHRNSHPVTVRYYPRDTIGYEARKSDVSLLTRNHLSHRLAIRSVENISLRVPKRQSSEARSVLMRNGR